MHTRFYTLIGWDGCDHWLWLINQSNDLFWRVSVQDSLWNISDKF